VAAVVVERMMLERIEARTATVIPRVCGLSEEDIHD